MNYQKPTIAVVGKAQNVVLGAKGGTPIADNVSPHFVQSINAYEADE